VENIDKNTEIKNKIWAFVVLGFFALVSFWTYAIDVRYVYLSAYLWFGLIYGMSLQYGRFCMASACRDLFAVGVPRMAVGIMIALALFSLVSALVTGAGKSTFGPSPMGWHVVIGGLIFGFGMVFAGGCASGSLYKSGEGSMAAWLVVLSISVSQALFIDVGGWANNFVPEAWAVSAAAKDLPEVLTVTDGWYDQFMVGHVWDLPASTIAPLTEIKNPFLAAFVGNSLLNTILPAALILVVIYIFWYRKGYMRGKNKTDSVGWRTQLAGYWHMIMASKRTAIAGIFLGTAAGTHMWVMGGLRERFNIFNAGEILKDMGHTYGLTVQDTVFDPGYWYVTTQEAQWVGWVFSKFGVENMDNVYFGLANGIPNPLLNPADWMSVALIGGAAIMALLYNEFKFKKPTLEVAMWAIIGGTLMGIGSRLAIGCNIGAFFAAVANGSPAGWLFFAGMTGGAYVGVKFFNWWIERKMGDEMSEAF